MVRTHNLDLQVSGLRSRILLGDITLPDTWNFLWVTEFPLFTHSDDDKEFLAKGRWSSSHHPFTAPMWQDIGAMYDGQVESVRQRHRVERINSDVLTRSAASIMTSS